MSIKASVHGPNRRRNRAHEYQRLQATDNATTGVGGDIAFRIKSLDALSGEDALLAAAGSLGDACLFDATGSAGQALLQRHKDLVGGHGGSLRGDEDPILIHFHDLAVFVLRCVPLNSTALSVGSGKNGNTGGDVMYLSKVHCHNHKICEDTVMKVTCCSRPTSASGVGVADYDILSAVGIEVYLRKSQHDKSTTGGRCPTFKAKDISRELMKMTPSSVLTVNESLVVTINGADLVCRVDEVRVQQDMLVEGGKADAAMDEPYRGRIGIHTEFVVKATDSSALTIEGAKKLTPGSLPDDVVHVTTSDMEWFPVRRVLLAPCIKLTKYVQAGRGKYTEIPLLPKEERSEDAPTDDGCPHCKVPIDCCTFDRVLIFITSLLYPDEQKFTLDVAETNALADAADVLGLQPLSDLCTSQRRSFDSRVRKDAYISLSEVVHRNKHQNELLIVLDGMVLDITRWIDEHPGGPSIIPSQALNMDCTVFFEMYHVSRQSFLYLKSFYIGELAPDDLGTLRSSANGAEASQAFLQSLRAYTDKWRVMITHGPGEKVHKSL